MLPRGNCTNWDFLLIYILCLAKTKRIPLVSRRERIWGAMMPGMSPGTALRELQQAQAGLRKARELLKQVKDNPRMLPKVFDAGWEGLAKAHGIMAAIPAEAANDDVLTKQLAVERYATALLVRLRRIKRNQSAEAASGDDDGLGALDSED